MGIIFREQTSKVLSQGYPHFPCESLLMDLLYCIWQIWVLVITIHEMMNPLPCYCNEASRNQGSKAGPIKGEWHLATFSTLLIESGCSRTHIGIRKVLCPKIILTKLIHPKVVNIVYVKFFGTTIINIIPETKTEPYY